MNVKFNKEDSAVHYEDLHYGDAFMFNQSAFIKTDFDEREGGYAVDLENGAMTHFNDNAVVTLVTADVDIH